MRRGAKKQKKSKNEEKILLIVENSEKEFFKHYFNKYLDEEYGLKIEVKSSAGGDKCNITNFNKMTKQIELYLKIDKYKAVFLMIDLDTKCFNREQNHSCLVKLKEEYLPKYSVDSALKSRFYLFVVCNEIESWFLTIEKDTNNPFENHKKEMFKKFKIDNEPQLVQRVVKELKLGKIRLDFSKNSSLQHFIKKLQEFS